LPLNYDVSMIHQVNWPSPGECTGTRPDYLANRADQKNEGPFGEKSRNSRWASVGDVGTEGIMTKGADWRKSWNQIQTLKECLCCHIYCAHLGILRLGTKLLELIAQSLVRSPSTSSAPWIFFVITAGKKGISTPLQNPPETPPFRGTKGGGNQGSAPSHPRHFSTTECGNVGGMRGSEPPASFPHLGTVFVITAGEKGISTPLHNPPCQKPPFHGTKGGGDQGSAPSHPRQWFCRRVYGKNICSILHVNSSFWNSNLEQFYANLFLSIKHHLET